MHRLPNIRSLVAPELVGMSVDGTVDRNAIAHMYHRGDNYMEQTRQIALKKTSLKILVI